jgi:flagellar motility protein MotE (MotC chaperone)
MKKAIVLCEILVAIFIVLKLFSLGGFLKKAELSGISPWFLGMAIAEPSNRYVPQDIDDQLTAERKLLASLTERQQQLDSREVLLKAEEKRLESLKKEIIQKIEALKGLEEKLTSPLEATATADNKRFRDLAKNYEAAPPQQVGTILERMDTKMAAGILMNMNNKKAGAIWAFISPGRSVEIAKEITNSQVSTGTVKQ